MLCKRHLLCPDNFYTCGGRDLSGFAFAARVTLKRFILADRNSQNTWTTWVQRGSYFQRKSQLRMKVWNGTKKMETKKCNMKERER